MSLSFDDLQVGDKFVTDSYEMTREEIVAFATQYDPQPFHCDDVAAKDSVFRGLAASGWHTAAVTMRLYVTSGPQFDAGSVGLGVEIAWPTPTRPGDILHVSGVITQVIPSQSKPDRGVVVIEYDTINQHGEIRQHSTAKVMMFRRSS